MQGMLAAGKQSLLACLPLLSGLWFEVNQGVDKPVSIHSFAYSIGLGEKVINCWKKALSPIHRYGPPNEAGHGKLPMPLDKGIGSCSCHWIRGGTIRGCRPHITVERSGDLPLFQLCSSWGYVNTNILLHTCLETCGQAVVILSCNN